MPRPAKPAVQKPKSGVAIALRVPEELADAIDAEIERLTKERPGALIHRSDVVREILHRALLSSGKSKKP